MDAQGAGDPGRSDERGHVRPVGLGRSDERGPVRPVESERPAEQLQWHGMDYRILLEGVRPLPGGDWRSVVPYDSWSPGLLNNLHNAAVSAMAPQGNRTVQRQRTTT